MPEVTVTIDVENMRTGVTVDAFVQELSRRIRQAVVDDQTTRASLHQAVGRAFVVERDPTMTMADYGRACMVMSSYARELLLPGIVRQAIDRGELG